MQSFVQHYGYWGLFLASVLSSACIPVPSEIFYGFAGALCTTALAAHARFSMVSVIVVGTVGSLVGAVIAYEVGRSAGRTIVDRWGKWILLTHKDLDAGERWFARYGSASVLVGPGHPGRAQLHLGARGDGRDEPRRASRSSPPSARRRGSRCSPGLGYAAGSNWKHVSHDFHVAQYPIIALIVVALAWGLWHRVRTVRRHNAS